MTHPWIADRTAAFDSSGIRKVFDLAAKMTDPINLSIGQPDFDVPDPVKEAAIEAIQAGKNGYALTQGMPVLRNKLQAAIDAEFGHSDRTNFVCSGTSGGLVLSMLALVNPGDEVIIFDPYFVMYESLVKLVGGVPVVINTYPDFRIDLEKVAAAITPKTKLILLNSPANPTGVVATAAEVEGLAKLTAEKNIALISDEIYRTFTYGEFVSPAKYNDQTIVIDGFSKSYGMTGWRVGYVHGPSAVIDTMIKLQQYTFVCAPQPAQWASAAALDVDMSEHVEAYARKRDLMLDGISDLYEVSRPEGAFYIFPKAPWGTGSEFVAKAIENNLLIIPGKIFSKQDTHFRISYAAADETLKRGVETLRKLAKG
ncbi:pyridoxal phosphate-dependent aminotransferase [Blastopirellula marina]|uniref:Aminotransferase n=1 Tax=Blastopirellula marina TaxID=124 RepID=A0A2S8FWJ4_9BACT|nr:aminotransferase class I/II-fold pyridoxal phosphate-dependent enzyme [Blastopirellula marina]PQO36551.1 aspartate aminotransferase [Blastopirellula marina]PQO47500.1 aspartate aminotransferase [Blastopirellula marina]PTL44390.1 aspartate aminotransferase [Blastopirellula marina]